MPIPVIDTRVKYVGASALRSLNAKALRELKDVLVVQVDEKPVAVIVPYGLYMRMQDEIWPSSLLPALEKFLGGGLAEGEVAPSLEESINREMDYLHETPAPYSTVRYTEEDRKALGCTCDSENEVADPSCPLGNHRGRVARPLETLAEDHKDVSVNVVGVTPEPRGAKFSRVDDSKFPVIDDVDHPADSVSFVHPGDRTKAPDPSWQMEVNEAQMEYTEEAIKNDKRLQGTCAHCEKVSGKDLCSDCFLAGHRSGNCLVCPKGAK